MKKTTLAILLVCLSLTYVKAFSNHIPVADSASTRFDEGSKFKLFFGNQTYDLISYSLNYVVTDKRNPNTNPNVYQPSSLLNIVIRTTKIDQGLVNWIFNPQQDERDAKIIVYDGDSGKEIKTITFSGLTTATYNENGNQIGSFPLPNMQQTSFGLRYRTITVTLSK